MYAAMIRYSKNTSFTPSAIYIIGKYSTNVQKLFHSYTSVKYPIAHVYMYI